MLLGMRRAASLRANEAEARYWLDIPREAY